MSEQKRCETCGKVLPLSDFCAVKGVVFPTCKRCGKERQRERREFLQGFAEELLDARAYYRKLLKL